MANFKPTIGLEIHVELSTKTKMFCRCPNDPNETHPNFNICEVCTAQPGTLPVINKKAVESVLKLGKALGSTINRHVKFDRKNYFYPDLPKGYQISQYDLPLCSGGVLEFFDAAIHKKVQMTRVHLEEDTARLIHDVTKDSSLIDFNRAGVPLMELVTEPDIHSASEAKNFVRELILILRFLGVSYANMEKGQLRAEANISVSSGEEFGTKVEIKNLNSLRAVEESIEYEVERQERILKEGRKVEQETRGWNPEKGVTFSQRSKEEAQDYRYFPEPDLPPLNIDENLFNLSVPELPMQKRERFEKEFALNFQEVDVLIGDKYISDFFEKVVSELIAWDAAMGHKLSSDELKKLYKLVFNYLTSDLFGLAEEKMLPFSEILVSPEAFAHLLVKVHQGELSSRMTKDILREMIETGKDPEEIIKDKGIAQISGEGELEEAIKHVVEENPKPVEDYKKGKKEALQFLVGKIMQKTKGQANPQKMKELLEKKLGGA